MMTLKLTRIPAGVDLIKFVFSLGNVIIYDAHLPTPILELPNGNKANIRRIVAAGFTYEKAPPIAKRPEPSEAPP